MGLFGRILDKSVVFSFDRTGLARHRKSFVAGDLDVDLTGRRCVVTGANSGLGLATATALAQRGADVVLACRHEGRGGAAVQEIRRVTGSDRLALAPVDVSSMASVRDFVAGVGADPVDVLVHNAGVLPTTRKLTEEGLELTWATNVVGPVLMTRLLRPQLEAAPQGRVVLVSSGGMYPQRLDLTDLQWEGGRFDGVKAYANTKRALVILAELLADWFAPTRVTVHSMHPGWADTPSVKSSLPRFHRLTRSILRSPQEGADTIVWLAVCERLAQTTGGFWFDRELQPTYRLPRTRELSGDRNRLWSLCESMGAASAPKRS